MKFIHAREARVFAAVLLTVFAFCPTRALAGELTEGQASDRQLVAEEAPVGDGGSGEGDVRKKDADGTPTDTGDVVSDPAKLVAESVSDGSTENAEAPKDTTLETQETSEPVEDVSVSYQAHVQRQGWQGVVSDGQEAGTDGQRLRMEAIRVQVDGAGLGVRYKTHIQTYGWSQGWRSDGAVAGTEGQAKRVEAIALELTGAAASDYTIWYRAHVQTYGWLAWAKDGELSGTAGLAKRIEALQILVRPATEAAPSDDGADTPASFVGYLDYQTHVQTYGWQRDVHDNQTSGTTGQAKRLEAIRISLTNSVGEVVSGGVRYRVHAQTHGWMNWAADGALSGTTGERKRLEAIRIELTGDAAEKFDIYYCVHAQTYGWLGWAKNGETAGTTGAAKRLEGIRIVMLRKGDAAPALVGSDSRAYYPSMHVGVSSYVEGSGWQAPALDGAVSGTVGQARGVQAVTATFDKGGVDDAGTLKYRTCAQGGSWESGFVSAGATSGSAGRNLEAMEFELTGELSDAYSVYYSMHVQKLGWLGWAKDGAPAGTSGYGLRVEALRVLVQPKSQAAPARLGSTDEAYVYAHRDGYTQASGAYELVGLPDETVTKTAVLFDQSAYDVDKLSAGFADNSVNSAAFRSEGLTTYVDANGELTRYASYYDAAGRIVVAKQYRGKWTYAFAPVMGDTQDAHNVVSIAVDGDGYLHLAVAHHAASLEYAVATTPGSIYLTASRIPAISPVHATYPQFLNIPGGDLFFLYREGYSGDGNVVLCKYHTAQKAWEEVNANLISGQGDRNAYWQAAVDDGGRLHLSWCWREDSSIVTNHDICYAVSTDATGRTFTTSGGAVYRGSITAANAEVAVHIPQGSMLMNQTSMAVDAAGVPYIATYWRSGDVVQYYLVRRANGAWQTVDTGIRKSSFGYSAVKGGTQLMPCARPKLLVRGSGDATDLRLVIRDDERLGFASVARLGVSGGTVRCKSIKDLTDTSLGSWEPVCDLALWKEKGLVSILGQVEHYQRDDAAGRLGRSEDVFVATART